MSRLSKALRKVSSKVVFKFGGDITIKRISSGIYNPSIGTVSETITSVTIHGVLQNVNQREINDLIRDSDKICTIAGLDLTFVPTTTDRVSIVNIEYQIIRIKTTENDNSEIIYKLYLRS